MPRTPLFSTYRQGENRVTASLLAVFQRIDLGFVEQLLARACGESSLEMVAFRNQVPGAGKSAPDAAITGSFRYLFEVKTSPNVVKGEQLSSHLKDLTGAFKDERLFVLTPDSAQPPGISDKQ